jgi:DNA-binding FrmR family transcriptional regulator
MYLLSSETADPVTGEKTLPLSHEVKSKTRAKHANKDIHVSHSHEADLKRSARIKGQIDGIERMLKEGRYCPDIIQQIKAVRSALRGLECAVLEGHLRGCVKKAFNAKDPFESEAKISELIDLMKSN